MRKVGDITEGGWEITKVEMRPIYTQRRKIRVVEDLIESNVMEKFSGETGWQYTNDCHDWVVLDKYPDKFYKFRYTELEIIKNL